MQSKFGIGVVRTQVVDSQVSYLEGWIGACLTNGTGASGADKNTVLTSVPDGSGTVAAVLMGTDPRVIPLDTSAIGSDPRSLVDNYHYSSSDIGIGIYGIYDPSGTASWPQKQTATTDQTSYPAAKTWTATNPYGAIQGSGKMFLNDYDYGKIFRYTTTADDYTEDGVYYSPDLPSGAERTAANAMDVQESHIIAAFSFYSVANWVYTYQNSGLFLLPLDNTGTLPVEEYASASCGKNVNGVTASGDFAYVTSYGGSQQGGGNTSSTLEVFQTIHSGSSYSFDNIATITTSMLPSGSSFGQTGDFIGAEIIPVVNGSTTKKYAFILLAHYPSGVWTTCQYEILRVEESQLQDGDISTATYVTGSVTDVGASWGLLKSDDDKLYFVDGKNVTEVNTAASTPALYSTPVCSASDFTSGGHEGSIINSAGIVTHTAVAETRALKGMPAPHVSVTKMAHRLITLEELKKRQKK